MSFIVYRLLLTALEDITTQYVDETPELTARYAQHAPPRRPPHNSPPSAETVAAASPGNPSPTTWAIGSAVQSPTSLRATSSQVNSPGTISGEVHTPGPLIFERQFARQLNLEEACLLRYFVEDLAKWVGLKPLGLGSRLTVQFDLCDPERHFAVVIPQRARVCPPLLDALLSTSARHFSTLSRPRQIEITFKYGLEHGLVVGEESTLSYHCRCITHLRSVSDEPDAIMDENLLAAVVALRFYEELDSKRPSETWLAG